MAVGNATYIASAVTGTNDLWVFNVGADQNLYIIKSTDGGTTWGSWSNAAGGAGIVGPPIVVSASAGTMDAFVYTTSGNIYWMHYNGSSWSSWAIPSTSMPATMNTTGTLAVSTPGGGVLDIRKNKLHRWHP